jgi:hypothetical protein
MRRVSYERRPATADPPHTLRENRRYGDPATGCDRGPGRGDARGVGLLRCGDVDIATGERNHRTDDHPGHRHHPRPERSNDTVRTAAGAEAFVRAYFDALGKAFAAGDPAGLSDYSTPACLRCEGFLRTLTGDHDHGRHGVGTFALIHRVTPTAVTTTSAVVDVDFDSPAAYVVDAQGTRVDERTAELSLRLRVRLEHSDHWRIVATELNP